MMVRGLVAGFVVSLIVACGDDGHIVTPQPTNPQPSEPEIVTEDDAPVTDFHDARGVRLVDGPDTEPHFIPAYWLTFEPSRLYILAMPGSVGPKTEKLKINNRGTEPVRLRSVSVKSGVAGAIGEVSAAVFDITGFPDKDTLGPGQSTEIEVTFYPTTSSTVSGTIAVLTDMPANPERAVPVTAKSFR